MTKAELIAAIQDSTGESKKRTSDIVDAMALAQPSVSKHLRVLKEVGLVATRRAGRQRFYRLNAEAIRPMHDWVTTFERYFDRQLDRVKERAEAKHRGPDTPSR